MTRIGQTAQIASLKSLSHVDLGPRLVADNASGTWMQIMLGSRSKGEFVVGYRLDFREHYCNLPYIGALRRVLREQLGK